MKSRLKGMIWVWAIMFFLVSCKQGESRPDYLGDINYTAPVVLLEYVHNDEGEFLEYREVLDLEKLINGTRLPIVICLRQINDQAGPIVIPKMEEWTVEYRDRALFVFADITSDQSILTSFEANVTPTFHLVQGGAKIMYASWEEQGALALMEEALEARTQGVE